MRLRQAKVFVIDDHLIIADTLATILRANGFDAESFTDPRTALNRSEQAAPDIVVSDVDMPQMDGIEFCRLISAGVPTCKCLLISGRLDKSEARFTAPNIPFVEKPISPNRLLELLSAMIPMTVWA